MVGTAGAVLKAVHPLVKLVVCFAWIAATILIFDARFQIAVALTVVIALVALDRVSPLLVLALTVPFALFGFGFLTTSLLFRQDADYALRLSEEALFSSTALSAGLTLFFRAIAGGLVSMLFVLTTDPGAFIRALMAQWRLPPSIGYALFSAMQLVPDLVAEARQIRLARAMKSGRRVGRFPGPVETFSLVIPLLAYAIRRAGRSAVAMEARGLGASRARTVTSVPDLHWRDAVFALAAMSLLTVLAAWAVSNAV